MAFHPYRNTVSSLLWPRFPRYPRTRLEALITILENERAPRFWGWGERREALRALRRYPYEITTSQDARLREIYRQERGTLQDFLNVLYNGNQRPLPPPPLPPQPRPDPVPAPVPVPPSGGGSTMKERLTKAITYNANWYQEDKLQAIGAVNRYPGAIPDDLAYRLNAVIDRGGSFQEFMDLLGHWVDNVRRTRLLATT